MIYMETPENLIERYEDVDYLLSAVIDNTIQCETYYIPNGCLHGN
jgi:hypothetical protein